MSQSNIKPPEHDEFCPLGSNCSIFDTPHTSGHWCASCQMDCACGPVSEADARARAEYATERKQFIAALQKAVEVIDGLADQYCMTDDWFVPDLERIRATLQEAAARGNSSVK